MPTVNILPVNCLNKAHPPIFSSVNKLHYTVYPSHIVPCMILVYFHHAYQFKYLEKASPFLMGPYYIITCVLYHQSWGSYFNNVTY